MAWGGQWCTSPGYAAVHESVAKDRILFARLVSVAIKDAHTSQTFAQLDLGYAFRSKTRHSPQSAHY
jgi:hypothetical protein